MIRKDTFIGCQVGLNIAIKFLGRNLQARMNDLYNAYTLKSSNSTSSKSSLEKYYEFVTKLMYKDMHFAL